MDNIKKAEIFGRAQWEVGEAEDNMESKRKMAPFAEEEWWDAVQRYNQAIENLSAITINLLYFDGSKGV